MTDPTTVLFLGGMGRSGTTLLERLLGDLPGVETLGELVHLWERGLRDDERCGCGEPFSSCPFWRQVGDRAFGGWQRLDVGDVIALKQRVDRTRNVPRLGLPVLAPSVRRDLRRYLDLYERVYAAAAEVHGSAVVVDSSKHASLAYCLRWSRVIDLRVVQVVRDSPAVAYSWTRTVQRPEATGAAGDSLGEFMPRYGLLKVVLRWTVDNSMFDLLRLLRVPVELLRYEDLVDRPAATLERLAVHAGLAPGTSGTLHGDRLQVQPGHTVAGNPMRFVTGELVLRPDDRWRRRYPALKQRLVRTLTAPLRSRYGYRHPRRTAAPPTPRTTP